MYIFVIYQRLLFLAHLPPPLNPSLDQKEEATRWRRRLRPWLRPRSARWLSQAGNSPLATRLPRPTAPRPRSPRPRTPARAAARRRAAPAPGRAGCRRSTGPTDKPSCRRRSARSGKVCIRAAGSRSPPDSRVPRLREEPSYPRELLSTRGRRRDAGGAAPCPPVRSPRPRADTSHL